MVPIIIDIVLVLIVVLFLILGIKRGLIKTIQGFISSILVIVIVVFTVVPITNLIVNGTEWDNQLAGKLETSLADKIPNSYAHISYYDLNEDGTPELTYEIDNQRRDYETIFDGSTLNFLGISKLVKPQVENKLKPENAPESVILIEIISETLTKYIFLVGIGIALLIIYKIILWLLFKLLDKLASNLYIMHFLNKTLGGIAGFLLGSLTILILLTIVQLLAPLEFMAPVNEILEKTAVTKFLMENNFLLNFVQSNVTLSKIADIIPKKK